MAGMPLALLSAEVQLRDQMREMQRPFADYLPELPGR